MIFLGQRTIMKQLDRYLPYLYENKEASMSFLLRAPSGWGKTRMAFMMCNYLTGGKYEYYLGDKVPSRFQERVVFIDEIHLLKTPEILYPLIDSGNHVFVFATNEVSLLAEALTNRCTNLYFEPYSNDELREIAHINLNQRLRGELLDYLIEVSASNPRVLKGYCSKINIINRNLTNSTLVEFKAFMKEVFGIKDGLDEMCSRYLETLRSLGGRASIGTIATQLRVDENSIKFYIEPVLLFKNLIQISSKGRILINE